MFKYNGQVVIPLERVCKDYFTHLTTDMFQRKVMAGQIKIPITRMEASQKSLAHLVFACGRAFSFYTKY